MTVTAGMLSRFWGKVSLPHCHHDHMVCDDCCWPWMGACNEKGYGQLGVGARNEGLAYAHRISWEIHRGPIPEGLLVLHHCDNPPCVNPAHLFLGTNADNMADMVTKGRHFSRTKPERLARGERHGTRTKPERVACGERVGGARLHADDVNAIRARALLGETQTALAQEFGVAVQTINKVVRGRTWRHLLVGLALLALLPGVSFAQEQGFTSEDTFAAIHEASVEIGVSETWLTKIIACETGGSFSNYLVGRQGELGAVQLHPRGLLPVFLAWGYDNALSPYQSVRFLAQEIAFGRGWNWSCAR